MCVAQERDGKLRWRKIRPFSPIWKDWSIRRPPDIPGRLCDGHPRALGSWLRASRPNEFWHVDTTVIRLLEGTRSDLHAVIDNFSRRIPARRVAGRFEPGNTLAVLLAALRHVTQPDEPPTLLAEGGVENFNASVEELIESGARRGLLAMTNISFSNSLIEAWWRRLKHQWLYLNSLDCTDTLRKLVAFSVEV